MPRTQHNRKPRREIDTREHQARPRNVIIPPEGPATLEVEPLEVIEGPTFKDREEALRFMEDELIIVVAPSTDPNAEDPIYVGVNGRACYLPRNKKIQVKRKYVERLARARIDGVRQDVKAVTPAEVNKLTITPAQRYPFSLIYDPHPNGAAWLEKITIEG